MLDIKLIRNDTEAVRAQLHRRGEKAEAALETLLALDLRRRETRGAGGREAQGEEHGEPGDRRRQESRGRRGRTRWPPCVSWATRSRPSRSTLKIADDELEQELLQVPNLADPTAPDGGEDDSVVLHHTGEPRQFAFPPRDHLDLGTTLDMIDMERGGKVAGTRFAYLKGDLVLLQFALVQFALQKLMTKGFRPVVPPVLVRDEAMFGTGFFPTDMQQVYRLEADALNLVGTSEVPLAALHMDEILNEADLPVRYVGYSSCFRREAGAAGKDTRGIFRVHQFDKVEMFSFCHPDRSLEEHDFMRGVEEEVLQDLGLPYRAVNIAAGDLGASAAKKYDLEAWIPTQERYREVTSCSNCTDYQARRLRCRAKGKEGGPYLVHTLNGTVVAVGRTIIAIMENYQTADGLIEVPAVLRPFLPAGKTTLGG